MDEVSRTRSLVEAARDGDTEALDALFVRHRERLVRMARFRLDPRLRGRVDPVDVVQDVHLEAFRRLDAYLAEDAPMPFFLWLRFLTGQKIMELHRRHVVAQRRDVRQEVRFAHGPYPDASTHAIADQLAGREPTPSRVVRLGEERRRLHVALDEMDAIDREVLTLRHFEQLSNVEAATELGLSTSATSKRYLRALRKLEMLLGDGPADRESAD